MEIFEAITKRQTYRLKFQEQPIAENHLEMIIEAFRWGPSPHTVQPAEAILINDRILIHKIADLTTQAAKLTYADGDYWKETYPWLRFSEEEFEQKSDGVYIDKVPSLLKPFIQKILSPEGFKILTKLGVTSGLAEENYGSLVRQSPLILAILQDKKRKAPGKRGGLWGLLGIGASIENMWLTATTLNIGCQPVTIPFEHKKIIEEIQELLQVPKTYRLLFIMRLGYIDPKAKRPSIGVASRERREQNEWIHYNIFK